MGGGKIKRRRYIEAWVWRNEGWQCFHVGLTRPRQDPYGDLHARGQTSLCPRIFHQLTGLRANKAKGMAPVRVRIPVWTVLDN